MGFSDQLLQALEAYCAERGWTSERIDDRAMAIPIDAEHGRLLCMVEVKASCWVCESLYAISVPRAKRPLAAELAARANLRTDVGALSVELDDGEIGFRTGLPFPHGRPDPAVIGELLEQHLDAADRWLPAVAAVVCLDYTPRAAIGQCVSFCTVAAAVADANDRLRAD
jgi:hypothetical protein